MADAGFARRWRVGGAVKAGPGGAARRGSLEGPGVWLSPATVEHDRREAVLVAQWWLGSADCTITDLSADAKITSGFDFSGAG
jgi:hypothetical protein